MIAGVIAVTPLIRVGTELSINLDGHTYVMAVVEIVEDHEDDRP